MRVPKTVGVSPVVEVLVPLRHKWNSRFRHLSMNSK